MKKFYSNSKDIKMKYFEFGMTSLYGKRNSSILFIHGLGSSSERWLDIPFALSRYYHTISVDLIGFGESDTPLDMEYSISDFTMYLLDFIGHVLPGCNNLILVGHSLGGYIACDLATKVDDQMKKIILIDSSGLLEKPTPLLSEYLLAAKYPTYSNVKDVFQKMTTLPFLVSDYFVHSFIEKMNKENAKYVFESTFRNSTTTQVSKFAFDILNQKQTKIIWGDNDHVIPIQYCRQFEELLPNASIEIMHGCGHAPFVERPATVCEIIHSFVSG
ncbi:MAG: alpha/beta hydrolase [Thermoproteota archaeon]|nr:alpha/beta hydrolase [Thermoproteota archaeon]